MRPWSKRAVSSALFTVLALSFLVIVIVPMVSVHAGAELSTSNEGWTGASEVLGIARSTGASVRVLVTTPTLLLEEESPEKVLFISLGPQRRYSLTETLALSKLTERGGRLLIADDTGRSASIAEENGVSIVKGQLYDQDYVGDVDHVKFKVSTSFFDGFVLTNRPASLLFSSGVAFIASSSSAWVDLNGNKVLDNQSSGSPEAQGVRYLCVLTDPDLPRSGGGGAVFLSDPSMFMNGMLEEEGNRQFIEALIGLMLPEGGTIVIDDSVHDPPVVLSPLQKALYGITSVTTDINMKIVVGTLITVALLTIAYLYQPLGRPEHECLLDRSGVAELAEPELTDDDVPELRRVLLDKVRLSYGMPLEAFSALSWKELEAMIGDEGLASFARSGRYKGSLEDVVGGVTRWQRR